MAKEELTATGEVTDTGHADGRRTRWRGWTAAERPRRSPSARRSWWAPTILGWFVLVWFAPVVFGGRVFFSRDAQAYFYPSRLLLRERLLALDLPEWLPELDLGMPFLASLDQGVLYPPNLLLFLPAPYCVGLFIVMHFVLAVTAAWGLARALRLGSAAASFGALGFALGGYMVSLTWDTYYMLSLAWLPLVALLALRTLREGTLARAAELGLAFGCQALVGEPHGAVLTVWFVIALVLARPGGWRGRARGAGLLLLGLGIAACLAMPQILPTLEYLPRTQRAAGIDLGEAQRFSLHPLRLGELWIPWLFGTPLRQMTYIGYFMQDEGTGIVITPWMATPYFGSLAALFAILGGICPRRRHRRWVHALLALTVVTLLLALGSHSPVFAIYHRLVPGAALLRYPAKYFGLLAATLPLIGAAGVDAWRVEPRRQRWFLAGLVVACTAPAVVLLLAPTIGRHLYRLHPDVELATAVATVGRAAGSELGLLLVLGLGLVVVRSSRWAGDAAAVALAAQLTWNNLGAYETAPASIYAAPALAREFLARTPPPQVPRVRHTMQYVGTKDLGTARFDALPGTAQAEVRTKCLFRNIGLIHGLEYLLAYTAAGEDAKTKLLVRGSNWERQLLDVYGVRFLVVPPGTELDSSSALERLPDGAEGWADAYENRTALPFVYPARAHFSVPDAVAGIAAVRAPAVTKGWLVAVEGGDMAAPQELPSTDPGSCRLLARPTDDLRISCSLARPAWVVINEGYHRNWRAAVDGRSAEIRRANALVMALEAPTGEHEIVLRYREPSLPIGFAGMGVGLLGSLLLILVGRRNRAPILRARCAPSAHPARGVAPEAT
ncbi:MAG: YfhO family protein [Polyangiaceae bacterium]|nr:YfhO family protein [Polyangiaceae bacterium]